MTFLRQTFDLFAGHLPLSSFKVTNKLPVVLNAVSMVQANTIASIYDQVKTSSSDGVIESFAKYHWLTIIIMLCLINLIVMLLNRFQIILRKRRNRRKHKNKLTIRRSIWEIIRSFCGQTSFTAANFLCLNLLNTFVVILYFFNVQVWGGFFTTGSILRTQPVVINTLSDLISSHKYPMFLKSDPNLIDYQSPISTEKKQVWDKFLDQKNRHHLDQLTKSLFETSPQDMADILYNIKSKGGSLITFEVCVYVFRSLYCSQCLFNETRFHQSEKNFDHGIYGTFAKPTIDNKLRHRLHWGFQQMFDMSVWTPITHKQQVYTLESMGISLTIDMIECLSPSKQAEQSPDDVKLHLVDLTLFMNYCLRAIGFSTLIITVEVVFNARKRHQIRRIRHRRK